MKRELLGRLEDIRELACRLEQILAAYAVQEYWPLQRQGPGRSSIKQPTLKQCINIEHSEMR